MGIKMLHRRLTSIIDKVNGRMGVAVLDVTAGEELGINADELFPMASVCKTPILVAAYRRVDAGKLSLDERIEITAERRVAGSGLLNFFDVGIRPCLRDLLLLMIVVSDNAATDIVLGAIGGPKSVTAEMQALGFDRIRLDRTIQQLLHDVHVAIDPLAKGLDYFEFQSLLKENEEVAARFQEADRAFAAIQQTTSAGDVASPRDIARLYGQIARSECASRESCDAILQTLERQQLRGRLPRNLPPGVKCCHKTGTLGSGVVSNDTGLIYVGERPIAVAVLSKQVNQDPADTNTAIARIGRAVYDHYASG